jgi:hypothetical protein
VAAGHSYRKWSPFCYERKLALNTLLIHLYHTPLIQLVSQLSTNANHLSGTLNSSALEMKSMRIAQADAARATAWLAGTLQHMNATVISALVEINTTAIRVNETIGKGLNSFHPKLVTLAGATIIYCEDDRISTVLYWQHGD